MNKNQIATYAAGVVAVGLVLAALGVQFAALVPYAVLLACPLMMLVMMRGMHGSHRQHEDQ